MWANPIDLEQPDNFLKVYSHKDPSEDRQAIGLVLVLDLSQRERLVEVIAGALSENSGYCYETERKAGSGIASLYKHAANAVLDALTKGKR